MSADAIVYTAIFGSIGDTLHQPQNLRPGTHCVAYTDTDSVQTVNGWCCNPPIWHHKNPRLRARRHKLLFHQLFPDVEITLWVDGCLTPKVDPLDLAHEYLKDHDICMFKHMQRTCIYQELEACIKLKKDHPPTMRAQVEGYRAEGYPAHNGLAETTAVLRRNTPAVRKLCEDWWHEVRKKSLRDQLSLDYLCWKHGIKYSTFQGIRPRSPHFDHRPHR